MKRVITSATMLALGAASLHAQSALSSPQQQARPWSVSAALRGFYDDNYTTSPKAFKRDSFGVEVKPSASYTLQRGQTTAGLSYQYGMRWYEDRTSHQVDHSHQLNGNLSHSFTERYKVDLTDSFVLAQEPEVLAPTGGPVPTLLRSEGDNIRNTAKVNLTTTWTELFSTVLGYSNNYYDYQEDFGDVRRNGTLVTFGSRSALLDRIEHLITLNGRWQALPKTVALLGYQYEIVDYTSKDPLNALGNFPNQRDKNSHYAYVGIDQEFTPTLNGSVRVGAEFSQYDNLPTGNDDQLSPYADANLTWIYNKVANQNSYVQAGVRHSRTQTDVPTWAGNLVLDAETTAVYGTLNHRITAKLTGNVLGQYQNSILDAGVNSATEHFFIAGVKLSYDITDYLAADIGYNYDRLDSDIAGRGFTRNRVFVGVRATY
jgi:hypothetical protein